MKTHLPLRRTELPARGVAPATAISARSTLDDRATWPHDVTKASVARLLPCESAECRFVNRPPASFSHRGAARGGTPKDVDARAPPANRRPADPSSGGCCFDSCGGGRDRVSVGGIIRARLAGHGHSYVGEVYGGGTHALFYPLTSGSRSSSRAMDNDDGEEGDRQAC